MKNTKTIFLMFILLLVFTACRDHTKQDADQSTEALQEAEHLDSISNELESTTESIEEQTKALQEALNEL